MVTFKIITLLYVIFKLVNCAKILGVFTFPSYSHQINYQIVMKELSLRGHQVVFVSTNPIRNESLTNLTEIDVSFAYKIWMARNITSDGSNKDLSAKQIIRSDFNLLIRISEEVYKTREFKNLLNMSEFDLFLTEWIHPSTFALSAKFKCPLVAISTLEPLDLLYQEAGNPIHPVLYPNFFLPFPKELSFWNRLASIEFSLWLRYFYEFELYPDSDKLARKYIAPDLPSTSKIAKNVSLLFVNYNPVFGRPRANVPTVIEVTGLHFQPPKPLPKDVKIFLDESVNGVVYFSLGTNVKSHMLSKQLKKNIFEAFGELPMNVLCKFDEHITNISNNVRIVQWLPQQDILQHPNVKVFITQGGLQSMEEAIRAKVPLIGIPFFIDQPRNMHKMMNLGIGNVLDKQTLTKELLKNSIMEIVRNKKYRKNIKYLSDLYADTPMKPLEKTIWWIEYAIRHKGTEHLRSPYKDISFIQYLYIDIVIFILFCIIVITLTCIKLLQYICRIVYEMNKKKKE